MKYNLRMFKVHSWIHRFLVYISVSLGEFSDTSTDESLVRKKVNDFHISDDEEKSSPRLSFLKTKKVNSDVAKDGQESVTQISEDMSPDVHDDPKSQNDDQEVGKEITEIKAKPRVLPIKKSTSSGNLGNYYNYISRTFFKITCHKMLFFMIANIFNCPVFQL